MNRIYGHPFPSPFNPTSYTPPPKKAIAVNIIPREADKEEEMKNFEELSRLVETYGGIVIVKILQKRGRPSAKTFLGSGKAEEVRQLAFDLKSDLIIVNNFLRASQANNLRKIFHCEVWDRFELILKIFQKHARTEEAKLQIELARLKYEFPKLFGKGITLSQQGGGFGPTRGKGETLLELKRRHLKKHINEIENKLKNIHKIQQGQRDRRVRRGFKTTALVGYTNSGKTTLLKTVTKKKNVVIANELFTTLDTRIGEMIFDHYYEKILVADTIGFIQDLPPLLFSSFLATLEEVKQADIILHVIDVSDPKIDHKIQVVEDILTQLNCANKPKIYIFNKIDKLRPPFSPSNQIINNLQQNYSSFHPVFISAQNKLNLDLLKKEIQSALHS